MADPSITDVEKGLDSTDSRSGLEIRFIGIDCQVRTRKGSKLKILDGVSGVCIPGRLLAVMGASGAGKTTLIDVLAGHLEKGVSGKLLLDGRPVKPSEMRKLSCYVLQRDVLLASATVKEAITTAALLRLPHHMSRVEKLDRVEAVICELELERCALTIVGEELGGGKAISGGERRRLSVALGLITNPRLVLLDEPTSGLDSETAIQLVKCLVKLADGNRTVVASIHQPNSLITNHFDDLLLLSHGRVLYSGGWQQSVPYFASAGFACPVYTNPSDYFLMVAHSSSDMLAEHWKLAERSEIQDSLAGSDNLLATCDSMAGLLHTKARLPADNKGGTTGDSTPATNEAWQESDRKLVYATSWMFQVRVLLVRNARTWYRTPSLFLGLLAQYMFSGIFLGLIYLQLGTTSSSAIFDRQSSLFLILIMLAFTPSATATTIFDSERRLLGREASSGVYKLSCYWTAKTIITLPIQVVLTVFYSVLVYFLVGYQLQANKFFIFFVTCIIFQIITETLGTLAAIATSEATTAFLLVSCILWILVAFSGFLIKATPVYMRWIPKISFVTFAYSLLYQNEFHGIRLAFDQTNQSQPKNGITLDLGGSNLQFQCLPSASSTAPRGPGGNNMTIAENMGALIAIAIVARLAGFFLLKLQFRLKRL